MINQSNILHGTSNLIEQNLFMVKFVNYNNSTCCEKINSGKSDKN